MACLEIMKKANKISVLMQEEGWLMGFVVFVALILISLFSQLLHTDLGYKSSPSFGSHTYLGWSKELMPVSPGDNVRETFLTRGFGPCAQNKGY